MNLFLELRRHGKLADKRHPMYEKNRFGRLWMYLMAIFWAGYLMFFGTLFVLFFISIFDTDKTVSETENRNLATMPALTASSLFDGSFMTDFETYYADTFPFRDELMQLHNTMSDFFSGTRTSDDIVLVERGNENDFAGQDITYDDEE